MVVVAAAGAWGSDVAIGGLQTVPETEGGRHGAASHGRARNVGIGSGGRPGHESASSAPEETAPRPKSPPQQPDLASRLGSPALSQSVNAGTHRALGPAPHLSAREPRPPRDGARRQLRLTPTVTCTARAARRHPRWPEAVRAPHCRRHVEARRAAGRRQHQQRLPAAIRLHPPQPSQSHRRRSRTTSPCLRLDARHRLRLRRRRVCKHTSCAGPRPPPGTNGSSSGPWYSPFIP